jgi:hypothetical protein
VKLDTFPGNKVRRAGRVTGNYCPLVSGMELAVWQGLATNKIAHAGLKETTH